MRTDFLDVNGKQFVVPMEGKHEHAWIDIGTAVSLGVSTRGVQESGLFRTFQLPLFPSFHSQHVQHVHQIKWELTFACAGKKFEIGGSTRFALWVRVKSASNRSWTSSARMGSRELTGLGRTAMLTIQYSHLECRKHQPS
ncbi:hypothetical protein PG997_013008 [Apiospora hydei]|uniref:Uncharacterized protein n=1 Tax=Apiospora hydei TaxID=1337664 RepID=A0ABR1V7G2_9PEZI